MSKSAEKPVKVVEFLGPIGIGKTTNTDLLVEHLGYTPVYEQFAANPFLEKSYGEENRRLWVFLAQVWFLFNKAKQIREIDAMIDTMLITSGEAYISFDMSSYMDASFARARHLQGDMGRLEYAVYELLFRTIRKFRKHPPTALVSLKAKSTTVVDRIDGRGREFEKGKISKEYIEHLCNAIYYWLKQIPKGTKVLDYDTENRNLVDNPEDQQHFVQFIQQNV